VVEHRSTTGIERVGQSNLKGSQHAQIAANPPGSSVLTDGDPVVELCTTTG
jgi:hypothetical protein